MQSVIELVRLDVVLSVSLSHEKLRILHMRANLCVNLLYSLYLCAKSFTTVLYREKLGKKSYECLVILYLYCTPNLRLYAHCIHIASASHNDVFSASINHYGVNGDVSVSPTLTSIKLGGAPVCGRGL